MHYLTSSVAHSPMIWQIIVYGSLLFCCWNLENIAGFALNYKKWKHAFLNAGFILTNLPGQYLMGMAFALVIRWTGTHQFGFLYHLRARHDSIMVFIAGFIFLDFGEYVYHILMHKIRRLWIFHLVHHSDQAVDVSTALREHPVENVIRQSFTLAWVLLSGVPVWVLFLRQVIQIPTTFLAHINYRLPEKIDHIVGLVFITPNLHQVHHHYRQPYTDCNYGDVLSVWDRLFKTFKKLPSTQVTFGVDNCFKNKDSGDFMSVLKIPFDEYKKNKI